MEATRLSQTQQCEPVVKIEPPEDIKDIHDGLFASNNLGGQNSLWTFLLKTVRYKYQKEHGRRMDYVKMTRLLLLEVELLMEEVNSFVQSCCCNGENEDIDVCIEVGHRVGLCLNSSKSLKVNEIDVIPSNYKDSIYGPLHKKEIDIMDVEQSMIHSVFQDHSASDEDDAVNDDNDDFEHLTQHFPELAEEFKLESEAVNSHHQQRGQPARAMSPETYGGMGSPPSVAVSGYPEPTLVPGKEGGKIKTFYKCEKCNKSFPKRKRYYNHKFNGKCTIEPKWIRWHKNHKRVECAHPDCSDKSHINYTYPGLMKHIIEMHTVQEDSVRLLRLSHTNLC